jgi:hypothetical protein
MATNNNCEPCNITQTVPVAPPPVCPVPACDELVPTECVVNNLLDDGCTSEFYQFNNDGSLTTNNGTPVSQDPAVPLGLTISPGQSLHTILTNLVDAQNCIFQPNVIAGMLQVIQANPNHPVSQIFCNLVCSCSCEEEPCPPDLVIPQVVFNPILETSVEFTFYAYPGVTYDFTFVNTTTLTPVTSSYLNYNPNITTPGLITVDTALLTDFDPLQPSSNYQVTITANSNGFSCTTDPWFFATESSISCNCDTTVINLSFEPGITDRLELDITYIGGLQPTFYNIIVYQGSVDPLNIIYGPAYTPYAGTTTDFCSGCPPSAGLAADTYFVYVQPICSVGPPLCAATLFTSTSIDLAGPLACDPPVITGVALS